MVVLETRYAAGDGVLIGTGRHWLLLETDPGPVLVDELWGLLGDPGPVVETVLETLEKHFPEGLPSLVLLDLTPGATGSATRGHGRLTHDGDERLLSVALSHEAPTRRLVGGVVSAGSARVREVAAPRLPARGPAEPATGGRRPLIDGIPSHILAASAPEREPDPQRLALALDSAPRSAVTEDPVGEFAPPPPPHTPSPDAPPAFEPARPPGDASDHDGHTTFRPPPPEDARPTPPLVEARPFETPRPSAPQDKHRRLETPDGRTVRKPPGAHLRATSSETVLGVFCPAGHVTAAYTPECRVCHLPVPAQEPQRVPRPRLGVIALPSGEVVPLDRGVVFGRKPAAVPGGESYPHLVHLPADSTYLSRLHLQLELDGWLVMARDLGSQGGTRLHVPGRQPEQLRADEPYALEHGHALDLADVYRITFEVTQ